MARCASQDSSMRCAHPCRTHRSKAPRSRTPSAKLDLLSFQRCLLSMSQHVSYPHKWQMMYGCTYIIVPPRHCPCDNVYLLMCCRRYVVISNEMHLRYMDVLSSNASTLLFSPMRVQSKGLEKLLGTQSLNKMQHTCHQQCQQR